MLFDHFDLIRIVNLPHRKDRRAEMRHQLAQVGLSDDPRVAFFDALSFEDRGPFRRPGSHGAFQSHLAILRESVGQSVLILQDDCDFRFPHIERYEMPAEWDVFYGGFTASDPLNCPDSDIVGAHFMGFSPRAVAAAVEYLSAYLEPDFAPDPRAAAEPTFNPAIRPPIDGAFVWFRRAHPELVTEFCQLSEQRPSRTDIGDRRWFDRIPGVRELAGYVRNARRARRSEE